MRAAVDSRGSGVTARRTHQSKPPRRSRSATRTRDGPQQNVPKVKILYDNDALHIAARLFDSQPELIGRRLSSRDGGNDDRNKDADPDADRIVIYLDSMYDRLTGASFGVSASNIQEDAIIFNDTFVDKSWDAVWQSHVSIDERGGTLGTPGTLKAPHQSG